MNLNFDIRDLKLDELDEIKFRCANCSYWLDSRTSILEDITTTPSLLGFIKSKFTELRNADSRNHLLSYILINGGKVKAAYSNKKCIGLLISGKYYLFPKLKSFHIYPPANDSIFLGCIHVLPAYRNLGVGKKLLIALEKDLIRENVGSIESIGKRINDDVDLEDYINSPIIPIKFLIKNGFYIEKNDPLFPLLKIDLSAISIVKDFLKSKLAIKSYAFKRAVKEPALLKKSGE